MSVNNPAHRIPRQSVIGVEGEWIKMFDPPTASPPTRELLTPTNPVPEFMAALGLASVTTPHTVQVTLLHGTNITGWNGTRLNMFTIGDKDVPAVSGGIYPGPTIRVPRGVIFHGRTAAGGPPPHTIHWHGIEPTPMNDGVGHCSMEIGDYTYQWQPNFMGSYFYHCHRNTMQHFEMGLFGFLIIESPDAFDSPGPFGKPGGYPRLVQANVTNFPQFPGFNSNAIDSLDPHAMTVQIDREALWVCDDIDSTWRRLMPGAFSTFPQGGTIPGVNDHFFHGDFHDFNPDFFFITGVAIRGPVGSTSKLANPGEVGFPAIFNADGTVPAAANSGVNGMQVAVNGKVGETILVRCLCAAYAKIKVTFPVDAVIIAFDGRALGVAPTSQYGEPFLLPAGTPFELTTARRFDALFRETTPTPPNTFANVEFRHNRSDALLINGQIPFNIV